MVLTGRRCPPEIIELADTVTEMQHGQARLQGRHSGPARHRGLRMSLAAISWSAGKDSCLALLRAREAGLEVRTFLTMLDTDGTSKSHALPSALIAAQVAALGGTWHPALVAPGDYGHAFGAALKELKASGHSHMVFGDIDLQAHRDWLQPMCERAGLEAVFPLWGEPRAVLAEEIIDRGIRAASSASIRSSGCVLLRRRVRRGAARTIARDRVPLRRGR